MLFIYRSLVKTGIKEEFKQELKKNQQVCISWLPGKMFTIVGNRYIQYTVNVYKDHVFKEMWSLYRSSLVESVVLMNK